MKNGCIGRGGYPQKMVAGKRRSLHSPQNGSKVLENIKRHPGSATHDYSNVLGWNRKESE